MFAEWFPFVNLCPTLYKWVVCNEALTQLSVSTLKQQPTLLAVKIGDYTLIDTQDENVLYTLGIEKTHFGSSGIIVTSQAASNCMRPSAFNFGEYTIWGCLAGHYCINCHSYAVIACLMYTESNAHRAPLWNGRRFSSHQIVQGQYPF
ncbi:hypothetical protein DPMN_144895 [Dreissena polymorpha]|uniref:Uncharacterized protein n=1 Tax=Dreissena polymorpha TaxID=45954 RepID=A0A9D4F2Z1_DREPO|nr:hypothetical protein DPMN_144895 [Dreissena polymorpha]